MRPASIPSGMSLDWIPSELSRLEREGLSRQRRVMRCADGWCEVDGRRLRDFASNDYLGLAQDPRVINAAREALRTAGAGGRASALVTGRGEWQERLERRLSEFEGTEAALVFPTGYAANVGTIAALVGPGDLVCSDRLNHASLIDGCRVSRATIEVYPHGDAAALETQIVRWTRARDLSVSSTGRTPRKLIVTDSIFSMDGDAAPLRKLTEVSRRQGAMLLVDEAHATGVLGKRGRGLTEELAIESADLIKVGTLSKAIGSQGGFVAGSQKLIDWLHNTARTQVFSTALAPPACVSALAAIDLIEQEPERRTKLQRHANLLRERLTAAGLNVLSGDAAPIVPVVVGSPEDVIRAGELLEQAGFLVAAIRPPSVPPGTSRLRVSLSAIHTEDDVERLTEAIIRVVGSVSPCHSPPPLR